MAGEVCARCLWTGPATSAPDGMCPVCGAPLPLARASAAPETFDAPDAPDATVLFVASSDADAATRRAPVDDSNAADLSLVSSEAGARISRSGSSGLRGVSRGRWALLAMNVGLLVIFVALLVATALGWRPLGVGVANVSSVSPSATATTPADALPTTGPNVLLPTPTSTTTPTATPSGSSGSGGVVAPTATAAPTVAPSPTPRPTVGTGGN